MTAARQARPRPSAARSSRNSEFLTAWLLLLLDSGATYGYELRRALEAHGVNVDPSVMYRTLRRLERDRCAESGWTGSEIGPQRRSYRLTPEGRRRLDEIVALLRDLNATFPRVAGQAPEQRLQAS